VAAAVVVQVLSVPMRFPEHPAAMEETEHPMTYPVFPLPMQAAVAVHTETTLLEQDRRAAPAELGEAEGAEETPLSPLPDLRILVEEVVAELLRRTPRCFFPVVRLVALESS
jgi:hypothetical protein